VTVDEQYEEGDGILASAGKGAHNMVYGAGAAVAAGAAAVTGANMAANRVGSEDERDVTIPGAGASARESASAAGLQKDAVEKIASVEDRAAEKVEAVDRKAMNEVAAIYRKRDVPMEMPAKKKFSPRTGRAIAGATAIAGAAGMASAAGLSSSDVDKIASIEAKAGQDVDKIDERAGDDIASVYEREGVSFAKPSITSSRAAVAATASGLKPSSVKKAAAIEKKATDKAAMADNIAVGEISAIYRENGLEPPAPKRKLISGKAGAIGAVSVVGAASAAAAAGLSSKDVHKIAAIEKKTGDEVHYINDKATKDLSSVYKKEGVEMPDVLSEAPSMSNVAAPIGVAATATAAGAAAAAGLGSGACRKVAGVEKRAADKIHKTDRKAMSEISSIYKKRGIEMETSKPKTFGTNSGRAVAGTMAVAGATGAAAAAGLSSSDVKKIADIELQTKEEIDEIDEKAGEEIAAVYHKEGVMMEEPEVGSSLFAGAASAAGLNPTSQKKVATIERSSTDRIGSTDRNAVTKISQIYQESGLKMKKSSSTKTKLGLMTAALGVSGATAAAAKSGMGSLDLARVREIENDATREMEGIDKEAGDDMAELYEKEGMWLDRPGASRAAGVAAATGLGFAAVKQVEATEEAAETHMDNLDKRAANEIIEADKEHALAMHKFNKKGMSASFMAKEEKAAAQNYGTIKEKVSGRIAKMDERAEDEVAAIYREQGSKLKAPRGFFTLRAASGATATTAAIKAAAEAAANRKKMFANLNSRSVATDESSGVLSSIGTAAHMGVYDVGHTIAKAGNAITGSDFEGPAEYDARAEYSAEQRARGCLSCSG